MRLVKSCGSLVDVRRRFAPQPKRNANSTDMMHRDEMVVVAVGAVRIMPFVHG